MHLQSGLTLSSAGTKSRRCNAEKQSAGTKSSTKRVQRKTTFLNFVFYHLLKIKKFATKMKYDIEK
jgi:hypothetical protein